MASTPLVRLPSELILEILSLLSSSELALTSRTCRKIRQDCLDDNLWRSHIQVNVPGLTISSPAPCATFRDLYLSMIPFWHLPRGKFWFANTWYVGRLTIVRYSQARQRIEGYALACKRENLTLKPWSWKPDVTVHKWDPIVLFNTLHPDFQMTAADLGAMSYHSRATEGAHTSTLLEARGGLHQNLYTLRREQRIRNTTNVHMWPPLDLPAQTRSYNTRENHGGKLPRLEEFSESTFLTLGWFYQNSGPPDTSGEDHCLKSLSATLPVEAYTPTAKKPWRGIYCGDYSGHGCEFVVVMQPDDPGPLPRDAWIELMSLASQQSDPGAWYKMLKEYSPLSSSSESSTGSFPPPSGQTNSMGTASSNVNLQPDDGTVQITEYQSSRKPWSNNDSETKRNNEDTNTSHIASGTSSSSSSSIHKGCIKAVKLTGDPNIPRGEITFIAPNISDVGLLRVADDDEFRGARVVRSVGHVAQEGFIEDTYIPSQLILVSHDQIAQYWEGFGHVSFYHRVDIDALVRTD